MVPILSSDFFGTTRWRLPTGEYHREDGPAIEYADGSKAWYQNGRRHRADGPAIEWANGGKEWYWNGQCHRETGPAIERADGIKEWWLHDIKISPEEFKRLMDEKITAEILAGITQPLPIHQKHLTLRRPSKSQS